MDHLGRKLLLCSVTVFLSHVVRNSEGVPKAAYMISHLMNRSVKDLRSLYDYAPHCSQCIIKDSWWKMKSFNCSLKTEKGLCRHLKWIELGDIISLLKRRLQTQSLCKEQFKMWFDPAGYKYSLFCYISYLANYALPCSLTRQKENSTVIF